MCFQKEEGMAWQRADVLHFWVRILNISDYKGRGIEGLGTI